MGNTWCSTCEGYTVYRCGCDLQHCTNCQGAKGTCSWYRTVGSTENRTGVIDVPAGEAKTVKVGGGWCAVVAVLLLGAAAGAGYGLIEVVHMVL